MDPRKKPNRSGTVHMTNNRSYTKTMFLTDAHSCGIIKRITMKKSPLLKFGNIPILTQTLYDCYSDLSSPADKIHALERDDDIILDY